MNYAITAIFSLAVSLPASEEADRAKLKLLEIKFPHVNSLVSDGSERRIEGTVVEVSKVNNDTKIVLSINEYVDLRHFVGYKFIFHRDDHFLGAIKAIDCNKVGLIFVSDAQASEIIQNGVQAINKASPDD